MDFNVYMIKRELKIELKSEANSYGKNLQLDVIVPHKIFKEISIESITSGDINLSENISTEYLKLKSGSGDLKTSATFDKASINSCHGDVELSIYANKDICMEITTRSGDVSTKLNNIRHVNIATKSVIGEFINHHTEATGYIANVNISTITGDITIE